MDLLRTSIKPWQYSSSWSSGQDAESTFIFLIWCLKKTEFKKKKSSSCSHLTKFLKILSTDSFHKCILQWIGKKDWNNHLNKEKRSKWGEDKCSSSRSWTHKSSCKCPLLIKIVTNRANSWYIHQSQTCARNYSKKYHQQPYIIDKCGEKESRCWNQSSQDAYNSHPGKM